MEDDIKKMKIAMIEIARAVESGESRGLGEYVSTILDMNATAGISEPTPRCDCEKCQAVRRGDNNGDDGVN